MSRCLFYLKKKTKKSKRVFTGIEPSDGGSLRWLGPELWKRACSASSFAHIKHPQPRWLFSPEICPYPHPHRWQWLRSEVMRCSVEISTLCQSVAESPSWFLWIKMGRPYAAHVLCMYVYRPYSFKVMMAEILPVPYVWSFIITCNLRGCACLSHYFIFTS